MSEVAFSGTIVINVIAWRRVLPWNIDIGRITSLAELRCFRSHDLRRDNFALDVAREYVSQWGNLAHATRMDILRDMSIKRK